MTVRDAAASCITQLFRGDGTTTKQMTASPKGALYIWCNGHLDYPKRLAEKIGREDLQIVSPEWLESGRWRGLEFTGLVIDHATIFTRPQYDACQQACWRVRVTDSAGDEHGST